jgi:hypothetical protein
MLNADKAWKLKLHKHYYSLDRKIKKSLTKYCYDQEFSVTSAYFKVQNGM